MNIKKPEEHLFSPAEKHFSTSSAENPPCVFKMRKPRKGCKESDAYYHWNDNTDEQDQRFFKVLMGDFHKRLVIPNKFAPHFRGRVARSIKLESRSGYTFDVQVAKNLGQLVLQSGWKSFVSAHDLKMGDFLVFKYDGVSQMKVLIFDISGSEKVPPYLVPKSVAPVGETTDILRSYHNSPMKPQPRGKKTLKQRGSSTQRDLVSTKDSRVHSVPSYILPIRTQLTGVQMKKLKDKVRATRSAIPIYACVLRKSSISGRTRSLGIPKEYADVYLPFAEQTLILQRNGKSWEVRCCTQGSKCRSKRLLKGWKGFARDNKLQLGDICLFELLKTKKYTMNVLIIRAK
ncbi:hypothetical protein ACP70R_025027 [Stipagrostis hirtigluma subsp. patula]